MSRLLGLFLLFGFVFCKTPSRKDYFHSSFECFSGDGFRSEEAFLRYETEAWLPMRAKFSDENKRIKSASIVLAGNSLVHLFLPELLEKEFPGKNVVNRGIGGDMTDTLLRRLDEDVLQLSPNILVLEIGGNDLIQGKCLSKIQANVKQIHQRIRVRSPKTKIVFMAVPPTRVKELNQIVPIYNLFLSSLARSSEGTEYVELWDVMRDQELPTLSQEFFRPNGDTLHFNEKGYSLWGTRLRPIFSQLP